MEITFKIALQTFHLTNLESGLASTHLKVTRHHSHVQLVLELTTAQTMETAMQKTFVLATLVTLGQTAHNSFVQVLHQPHHQSAPETVSVTAQTTAHVTSVTLVKTALSES